jgi:putative Mg2+ transporter-C (MgtC) family protein
VISELEQLLASFRVVPHAAGLAFAYVLALPIGWDRERKERSAGIRTFPLVAIASCGFVQATEALVGHSPEAQGPHHRGPNYRDRLHRRRRDHQTWWGRAGHCDGRRLWATGAVGVAVGLGSYDVAIVVTAFTIFTFRGLSPLKEQKQPGDDLGPPDKGG